MTVSKRALVLGGGGSSGNAWLIGVAAGLFEAKLNVSGADLIVGTSAGSTAAAQITTASPTQLLASILSAAPPGPSASKSSGRGVAAGAAASHLEKTSKIINAAEDAADMRRKIGAAALELEEVSDHSAQAQWRATVASRLPSPCWPQKPMLITAVNARNGDPIVFDQNSGIDLVDAVAASCAGRFAYATGDSYYIDGGYRADVNADLAAGYERVLIIAPLGDQTRKPLSWGLHLAAQVDDLRKRGSRVETIFPDTASKTALGAGMGLMDISTRRPAAEAGYIQGKALAKQFTEFWR